MQNVIERSTGKVFCDDRDVRWHRADPHELHDVGAAKLTEPLALFKKVLALILIHFVLGLQDLDSHILTKMRSTVHNTCGTRSDPLLKFDLRKVDLQMCPLTSLAFTEAGACAVATRHSPRTPCSAICLAPLTTCVRAMLFSNDLGSVTN